METFLQHARHGLRTTLEVVRAIFLDLPLHKIDERMGELYVDPSPF